MVANPDPIVNTGYDLPEKKSRRKLFRMSVQPSHSKSNAVVSNDDKVDPEPMEMESLFLLPSSSSSSSSSIH